MYTVRSRSLRDHTFKKLINFSISVRERVWGIIFKFEGTSGGPCRELIFEFESPPVNAACALLLLLVTAEAVAEASRIRPGGSHWRAWSSFRFSPSKPLQIIGDFPAKNTVYTPYIPFVYDHFGNQLIIWPENENIY